jgi:hypothetical protein
MDRGAPQHKLAAPNHTTIRGHAGMALFHLEHDNGLDLRRA